jgi:hypothetical protein
MAWDTQYALEGFFLFGGPLNVTRYVIDPDDNKFGQSTETYWVARFMLDEEIDVIARLNTLIRGPFKSFPVLYLLHRSSASVGPEWVMEERFYKSWLFSMGGNFVDPYNPGAGGAGQTLGIAFNKANNRHILPRHPR